MNSHLGFDAWANEMDALDCKEQAQLLQAQGYFERALPLMLKSVSMRENSHTLCLSLSELAELYLDMLHFPEAESIASRMIKESWRYDTSQQVRIAEEILEAIETDQESGIEHGDGVSLCGLKLRPELNNKAGIIRGKIRDKHRYCVQVGSATFLVQRHNLKTISPGMKNRN